MDNKTSGELFYSGEQSNYSPINDTYISGQFTWPPYPEPETCPYCGRCRGCGRRTAPYTPFEPYYPYYPTYPTTTGDIIYNDSVTWAECRG